MKWIKRIGLSLVITLAVAAGLLWITGNDHILRGIPKTYLRGLSRPDIDDMELHPMRTIPNGTPEPWAESSSLGQLSLSDSARSLLEAFDTEAYLVWLGDSLVFEEYWNETTASTHFNSFSMAKSFTSLGVGCAWGEGKISSLNDPLSTYLDGYSDGLDADVHLDHLLHMASGIDFGESYNSPFGYMAKAYFGTELEANTRAYHATDLPGTEWNYEGGNTVLLGMTVQKVTGKPLAEYFSDRIWSRIGAEHPAYWNLDTENGLEKAFSAFYATPRDFGRIGKLMLDSGRWNGEQLVPERYLKKAFSPCAIPDVEGKAVYHYGYQFWLNTWRGHKVVSCNGMRGQYILTVPDLDMIVVRIGHTRPEGKVNGQSGFVLDLLNFAAQLQEDYAERH